MTLADVPPPLLDFEDLDFDDLLLFGDFFGLALADLVFPEAVLLVADLVLELDFLVMTVDQGQKCGEEERVDQNTNQDRLL